MASTLLIDIYGASKENTWKNLNNPGSILLEGILGQNKDYLKKTVEGENFDLIVDFIPSSMEEPNPLNEKWDRLRKSHEEKQANAPHCPACNSTNIDTISFGRKAVGFATMGIFSKSAKSQFKCNNCGYMF
ncbi:MAG: hypothetical protein LUE21_05595 [Oscillospiraceae bacterium]|nr:hypothetical protein [Oscillospiraceae bacterium]